MPRHTPQHDRQSWLHACAARYAARLAEHYSRGFGIMPSAHASDNFYGQIWARDFAHAAANYFIETTPLAVRDSLATFLRHQRRDGALPLRVEREYMLLKVAPGLRFLARPAFNFFEKKLRGRDERPVYAGQDFSSAEDTIPALLIAAGRWHAASPDGRSYIEAQRAALRRAYDYFRARTDPHDGLIAFPRGNVDWTDSIIKEGKLSSINVLWGYALKVITPMLFGTQSKKAENDARAFSNKARGSLIQKFYCADGAYFRTKEGEDRLDTATTVFGSLFFLDAMECARIQDTLRARVKRPSGFSNFDPPYPPQQILWPHRIIGHQGYHNEYVWPWITCQNIHVKIKIAQEHPCAALRKRYQQEAIDDLYDTAALFEEGGGAYEIFSSRSRKPALTRWYHPPQYFMANLAAFEGAYRRLRHLGWLS